MCFLGLKGWWASQVVQLVKNLPANAGDTRDVGLTPGSGRSPGEGNGNPLQYSCLEHSMDRRAWWATIHGAAKTQLSTHTHTHTKGGWSLWLECLGRGLFSCPCSPSGTANTAYHTWSKKLKVSSSTYSLMLNHRGHMGCGMEVVLFLQLPPFF